MESKTNKSRNKQREKVNKRESRQADNEKNSNPSKSQGDDEMVEIDLYIVIPICALILSLAYVALFNKPETITVNQTIVKEIKAKKPIYWVYSAGSDVTSKTGMLKHVHQVLDRLGLEQGSNTSDWDLLWSHEYPFTTLNNQFANLKSHQIINHIPGIGHLANKQVFATKTSKYIPKSFKLPEQKHEFLQYSKSRPDALFIVKDNQKRGVMIKNVEDIDVTQMGKFVQEYIQKPFLVDGHKFDIGVYAIITSVDPLRVYIYKGDMLFRFCPEKYHPFDHRNPDKYVVGDNHIPPWEMPSLTALYNMGYSLKDSFDEYVRKQGKDPSIIWEQVEHFLQEVILDAEPNIMSVSKSLNLQGSNFFEIIRFDFAVDENLHLHAIEANMTPSFSSTHFPANKLLFEQILFSLFPLVGVGRYTHTPTLANIDAGMVAMKVSDKNLLVYAHHCTDTQCKESCDGVCAVCKKCLSSLSRSKLAKAYLEHMNRNECKRIFPPPMVQSAKLPLKLLNNMTLSNKLMHIWFQGKCNNDITFCS